MTDPTILAKTDPESAAPPAAAPNGAGEMNGQPPSADAAAPVDAASLENPAADPLAEQKPAQAADPDPRVSDVPPVEPPITPPPARPDGAAPFTPWSSQGYSVIDHDQFLEGQASPMGNKIKRLRGRSRDFLVFVDDNDTLCFHYNDPLPLHMRPALQEFRRLRSEIPIALTIQKHREYAESLIASGLVQAFGCSEKDDVLAGFKPAAMLIQRRCEEPARSNYLFITAMSGFLVFVALFLLREYWTTMTPLMRDITLGGMGGIVGACISLIQRGATIDVDVYSSRWHRAFHAVMRALLGMLFGMIMVIFFKARLLAELAGNNLAALFVLALIGGASERLVPDLMDRFSQQQTAADPKKP